MSYRFLNAVLYNKTEDELISDLNSVRDDYHKFISKLIKQHAETYIDFGDRKYKPDEDENGNPILVTRASSTGGNAYEGIHFIVVQRDPLAGTVNNVSLSDDTIPSIFTSTVKLF